MKRSSIAIAGALGLLSALPARAVVVIGPGGQPVQPSANEVQSIAQRADGVAAGVVKAQQNGILTVTPYSGGQVQATLDPNTPVYQGKGRITTRGLLPGVDVRLYTQQNRAIGVEVLSPEQARAMRQNPPPVVQAPQQPQPPVTMQNPPPVVHAPTPSYPAPRPQPSVPPPQASIPPPQQPAQPAPAPMPMREDGAQAGKIVSAEPGRVILDPYEERAGVAYLQLQGDRVNVTNGGQVPVRELWNGRDVRVHYQNVPGQRPLVVSVELLTPEQARQYTQRDNAGDRDRDQRERHDQGKHKGWEKQNQKQRSDLSGPHQPGKVISMGGGYLLLDPYQRAAGDSRLRIDRDTPVYRDGERVGIEQLKPGADVQVFYDQGRVKAVDLLDRKEAAEQRRINEHVPRGR